MITDSRIVQSVELDTESWHSVAQRGVLPPSASVFISGYTSSAFRIAEFIALEHNMSRVLVIGSDSQVSREVGSALSATGFPMEYSAGHANVLQRLRKQSFGVVITSLLLPTIASSAVSS